MSIDKKSLNISKTNLGLNNVSNLSAADIALLMSSIKYPQPPTQDGTYKLVARVVNGVVTYEWILN